MAVRIEERHGGRLLEVHVTGKLQKEDYEAWVPHVERLVRDHGRIRILFEMHDFHGWTPRGLWQDVKFDLKHFASIERLAMVGEAAWQRGMSWFCWPFTMAKIRYFTQDRKGQAIGWLEDGLRVESTV